jgi:predicted amidohydrolase
MADTFWVPKNFTHDPTEHDRHYAEAFDALSTVLNLSTRSEDLALRLSTCRNAYLTINGLFATLRTALGHGMMPSATSRTVYELRRGEWRLADEPIDEIRTTLSICDNKWRVWRNRRELDAELQELLENDNGPLKLQQRDLVRSIIRNVATSTHASGVQQHWDPVYVGVSQDEPTRLSDYFQRLQTACSGLAAIADVARALAAHGLAQQEVNAANQLKLPFGNDAAGSRGHESLWCDVHAGLITHQSTFAVDVDSSANEVHLRYPTARPVAVRRDSPDPQDLEGVVAAVLDHLTEVERSIYDDLAAFRRNEGTAPLPPTFEIDLSELQGPRTHQPTCALETVSLSAEHSPDSVKIAIPAFGWPLSIYTSATDMVFRQEAVNGVNAAIKTAIETAKQQRANVVVFPEYFVPRVMADEFAKSATDAGMVFIAGLEGRRSASIERKLENSVLVHVPGMPDRILQLKHYPSVEEPADMVKTDTQIVITHSPIGNFSVVLCSDLLEHHVLNAVASATPPIDILFVCAFNPEHHPLFRHAAIADAARLYCHVVIANNGSKGNAEGRGSALGSGVFLPTRDYNDLPLTGDPIRLNVPQMYGQEMAISLHQLSLNDLRSSVDREKPHGRLLSVPNFRRKFDSRGV